VPAGATVIGASAAKGIVNEPVFVPKPCDCKSPVVDIASVVDLSSMSNDDARSGISPAEIGGFAGSKTLDLMCGRYYFEQMNGPELTVRLRGRTVIAVGGDVLITGQFLFELSPGAELDLFVRGNMNVAGTTTFGSTAEPAKIRVYVAGASVFLPAASVGAEIYAPAALIAIKSSLEMSGALFADRFSLGGSVTVHYDEAILGGRGCPDLPGRSCSTCKDCGSGAPACRQGTCSACVVNADCCPPLACKGGSCVPPDVSP
jgi:hypothetical protein